MSDIEFLREAARYFEKRDAGGEDMAYWANVNNARQCNEIADTITNLRAELAAALKGAEDDRQELFKARADLATAIKECDEARAAAIEEAAMVCIELRRANYS